MTAKEQLMYKILGKISNTGTPIVFKGALITKLILTEGNFNSISRETKDIDANWVGTPPTMNELVTELNKCLDELREQYVVIAKRAYGIKRLAGVSIIDRNTQAEIISMDIDIKEALSVKTYFLGETQIKGVLPNEILADKITAVSTDAVYKNRAKDLVDIYSLSHCTEITPAEIKETCEKVGREISSFDGFFNEKEKVEHAYCKLKGVEGKPDFESLYFYLSNFLTPFAMKCYTDNVWNAATMEWGARELYFDEPER